MNTPELIEIIAPEPRRRFRHRRPWLFRSLLGFVILVVASVAVVAWVLGSTAGARVLLGAAGLKAEGLEGSLVTPLRAKRIEFRRPDLVVSVDNAAFDWSPLGLLQGRLQVSYLTADAVDFAAATPATKKKAELPKTLKPPLTIRVEKASVKRIGIATLEAGGRTIPRLAIEEFALDSAAGSTVWAFESVSAQTPAGRIEARGTIGAEQPFPLDITATLTGEREGRRYRVAAAAKGALAKFEALVRGEEGGITGSASVSIEALEDQPVKRVVGKLEGIDVNAFASAAPHTRISVEADLAPARDGAFAGPVRMVNAEPGPIDQQRLPVAEARGIVRILAPRYELAKAVLAFSNGGAAEGDIRVDGANAQAKLAVRELDLAAWHTALRPTKLSGVITADATAKAQRFEVELKDPRFEVSGRAAIENQRLSVETARIARGPSIAVLQGAMALAGPRDFDFTGTLEHVDPSLFADAPAGDLNGKARAKGTLEGGLAGELSVELADSRLAGLALGGRANVAGAEKRVARADVDFTLANARIQANGSYGHATDALEVKLEAPDMAPIAKAFKRDFAGSLSAQARLVGTFAALAGRVSATGEKLRVPGGFGAATMSAQVEVSAQADGRVDGKVEVTGLTRVTATTVETLAERATVTLAGTRADHRATLDAQLPPERRDSVTVSSPSTVTSTAPPAPLQPRRLQVALAGGLVEPAATPTWKGRIESFVLSGPNPLRLTGPAPLTLSRELVEVSEALVRGEIGAARFALTRWTPTRIEARGSSNGLLTRSIFRALGLSGQARSNLVLAADWDVRAAETLDGFVRVKRVEGDVRVGEPPISLGIEEFTLSLEATRGQVRAALALRGKQLGRIEARGATQVRKEGAAWGLTANVPLEGNIDADVPSLAWASDWLGPDARLDGRLRAKVALGGTLASPTYRGTLTADGVLLRDATAGFEIDEGRAALALNEREVVIERFELVSAWRPPSGSEQALARVKVPPKGTISAEGRLDFGSRTGSITVKAEGYPVSQLPARFLAATGEAKLETREGGLALSGAFKADAGYFSLGEAASPRVSEDVLIDRGEGVEEKKAQKIALDVRFNLGDHLHFAGRGLATRLGGELRVRGDPDRTLVASGQIRTVGGTYDAYGQKLAIERGVLAFQGPLDNPQLNVLAVREGLPVVAGVEILGSVGRPQVRLFSRPDVPDPEKLTWLVLGRGPGEASEGDTATLFAAANALLGANVENRKLFRQLGFDDVGFGRGGQSALGAMPQSSVAGRTGSTSGAEVFTVGKRLSRNLYVSYQHGLADAQATVRFAYTVSRRLQLLLIAGDKPGVDAVYRFTFE